MRMDISHRAHVLMDMRAAQVSEFKHFDEHYNKLMKFAL